MRYFALSFYDGEGDDQDIKNIDIYPPDGKFKTCRSATVFAKAYFNIDGMRVTEMDDSVKDEYGDEIIGSCNAGEAYECNYKTLDF